MKNMQLYIKVEECYICDPDENGFSGWLRVQHGETGRGAIA
jgi:hypothetical protein